MTLHFTFDEVSIMRRRLAPKPDQTYPYKTHALLGNEEWKAVIVLGPPRTIAVSTRVKGLTGMRLVEVQVAGEKGRRRIALERLQEHFQ